LLDHATSEMAIGGKLGIDATKKLPGEGFKHPWPPLIKMDDAASSWKAILEFLETELRNRRENSTDK
jgi:3-polyprenyl-4-hydroxybenzoate decarboxylase